MPTKGNVGVSVDSLGLCGVGGQGWGLYKYGMGVGTGQQGFVFAGVDMQQCDGGGSSGATMQQCSGSGSSSGCGDR